MEIKIFSTFFRMEWKISLRQRKNLIQAKLVILRLLLRDLFIINLRNSWHEMKGEGKRRKTGTRKRRIHQSFQFNWNCSAKKLKPTQFSWPAAIVRTKYWLNVHVATFWLQIAQSLSEGVPFSAFFARFAWVQRDSGSAFPIHLRWRRRRWCCSGGEK